MTAEQQFLLTFVINILLSFSSCDDGNECFARRQTQVKNLATKTPYDFIARKEDLQDLTLPKCEAVQFWMVARHGTRYPSKSGLKSMLKDLPNLAQSLSSEESELCQDTIQKLQSWKPDLR